MSLSKNNDSGPFRFDPTRPDILESRNSLEIPAIEPFEFISGTRYPTEQELARYFQSDTSGALVLPATIPLVGDPTNNSQRIPLYGREIVIPSEIRASHTAIFAPTGGGKNTRLIEAARMRAIKDSNHTVVSFSLKSSDFGLTHSICQKFGRELHVINLTDPWRGSGFNPLDTKSEALAFAAINCLADSVNNRRSNDSRFWKRCMVQALRSLWLEGIRSFPEMLNFFSAGHSQVIKELKEHKGAGSRKLSEFLASGSHNAETVIAEIVSSLDGFGSDSVARAMSHSELAVDQLFEKPICLHVEIREASLEDLQPIYQMIARTILDRAIEAGEKSVGTPQPVTFFFDDAPSLGGEVLSPERLMTMRSRNIGVVCGIQSLASLECAYGPNTRALIDNFHTKIILPGGPADDSDFFAKASGERTVTFSNTDGQTTNVMQRPLLSSAAIRTPDYSHYLLGQPATLMMGSLTFQAYLQKSYELPEMTEFYRIARNVTGRERLRSRKLRRKNRPSASKPKKKVEAGLPEGVTDTRGWSDDQLRKEIESLRNKLDWKETTGSARKWWLAFENENTHRLALVLRLCEELCNRNASIKEFFLAYVYSNTDNIQANIHYLDYTRLKKKDEEKRNKRKSSG